MLLAVRALLEVGVPAFGATGEQQGEVKSHGTLVLIRDKLRVTIYFGNHQVMLSIIAQHTELL